MDTNVIKIEVGGICFTADARALAAAKSADGSHGAINWTLLVQVLLEAIMKYFAGSAGPAPAPTKPAAK